MLRSPPPLLGMKVEITNRIASSSYGAFEIGAVLSTPRFPVEFLEHLVRDCQSARVLDAHYETKVDEQVEVKKKDQSTQSSGQGNHSRKRTAGARSKGQRAS